MEFASIIQHNFGTVQQWMCCSPSSCGSSVKSKRNVEQFSYFRSLILIILSDSRRQLTHVCPFLPVYPDHYSLALPQCSSMEGGNDYSRLFENISPCRWCYHPINRGTSSINADLPSFIVLNTSTTFYQPLFGNSKFATHYRHTPIQYILSARLLPLQVVGILLSIFVQIRNHLPQTSKIDIQIWVFVKECV